MEHHLAKVGVAGSIPVSRFFFCAILGTGIGPARGFGLRSASVCALRALRVKRVPLARGGLRSAPVGAKRVPLARSTVSRFFLRFLAVALCGSFFVERWRSSKFKTALHDCPGDFEGSC